MVLSAQGALGAPAEFGVRSALADPVLKESLGSLSLGRTCKRTPGTQGELERFFRSNSIQKGMLAH